MSQPNLLSDDKPVYPAVNYLNADRGVWSWLTTVDHKRIGIMYLCSVLIAFLLGGIFAMALRVELLTPGPTIMGANTYNRMFTLHGVVMIFLFMIPAIPGVFGNFCLPLMLGAKDVAFPQVEPAVALPLLVGRDAGAGRHDHGRDRHRLDVLRAVQHDDAHDVVPGAAGRLHPGVLVDPHRPQLHRHRSHVARARHGLDAPAALRLGDLRHQHHPGAGDAGHRPDGLAGRASKRSGTSACSIPAAAATRCCSSTCSGSTRTRPSTSWCCRRWASSPTPSPPTRARTCSATR